VLILVRHGRTDHNARRLLVGRLDPPLDDLGAEQAVRTAATLGRVDRVVSSPLARTRATAAAIAGPGGAVDLDDRWLELDYGDYDGMPLDQVPAELWSRWLHEPEFAPPGGESLAELQVRVAAACADLQEDATARDVVVVSHVSPIKAAVVWALGGQPELAWRFFVAPASITTISFAPRGPVLHSFNETVHLKV
jgi:broad specificity phosphatase PhoE